MAKNNNNAKVDGAPEMLSLKNLKLLVDLYQFLPPKKNQAGELSNFLGGAASQPKRPTRNAHSGGGNFSTLQPATPLDHIVKEQQQRGARQPSGAQSKFATLNSDMPESQKAELRQKLS